MAKLKDIYYDLKECMENGMEDADIRFCSYKDSDDNFWDINCMMITDNEQAGIKRIIFKSM